MSVVAEESDSTSSQPGFLKKVFVTVSQVYFVYWLYYKLY